MGGRSNAFEGLVGELEGKRILGRPTREWVILKCAFKK
jgi:hypothetical protein